MLCMLFFSQRAGVVSHSPFYFRSERRHQVRRCLPHKKNENCNTDERAHGQVWVAALYYFEETTNQRRIWTHNLYLNKDVVFIMDSEQEQSKIFSLQRIKNSFRANSNGWWSCITSVQPWGDELSLCVEGAKNFQGNIGDHFVLKSIFFKQISEICYRPMDTTDTIWNVKRTNRWNRSSNTIPHHIQGMQLRQNFLFRRLLHSCWHIALRRPEYRSLSSTLWGGSR